MAALTNQLQTFVTKTSAPYNGTSYTIDNTVFSSVPDWTIWFEVSALSSGAIARLAIQDSVDAFTTPSTAAVVEVSGQVTTYGKKYSIKRSQAPGLRFGVANAVLRISLLLLQGVIPTITFRAQYEGPLSS